ncbi:hypothetical protein P2N84_22780, partial [Escherichia coli]
ADRNRSHWSTSKTPSYTKSVSWQHHLVGEEGHAWLSGVAENQLFTVVWGEQSCIIHLPERLEDTTKRLILPCH